MASSIRNVKNQWQTLIQKDLSIIWSIHTTISKFPVKSYIDRVVSSNPFSDISILTWFCFAAALSEFGFALLWICTVNLLVAQIFRWILGCRRPFEYDGRMRRIVKTDKYVWSYGFPSLETHMAVVVYGGITYFSGIWSLLLLFTPLILFIGFTRVYACARFCWQVVVSLLTGVLGLCAGISGLKYFRAWGLPYRYNIYWLVFAVTAALVVIGLWVENNECSWFGVPKEEYHRVLTDILQQAPIPPPENQQRGADARRRRKQAKKDSFYHLQKAITQRALETRQIRRNLELEDIMTTPLYDKRS
mmetsp:Transcript_1808/g.2465  ORF Transcript_1808/g.2465 Transcript_1808/m.2465 type:complete len:304 (+) Transcript_1808:74-985(+)